MNDTHNLQANGAEKHSLTNLIISLHDSRARVLWTSDDPHNVNQHAGMSAFDLHSPEDQHRVREAVSKCFLDGESVAYIADAGKWPPTDDEQPSKWRVTLLPASSSTIPGLAGVAVGSKLPTNYPEITEDEKALLRLLADDCSHKEIAATIHRSESAVDSKIRALKDKLGCKGIGGLVGKALQQAII